MTVASGNLSARTRRAQGSLSPSELMDMPSASAALESIATPAYGSKTSAGMDAASAAPMSAMAARPAGRTSR